MRGVTSRIVLALAAVAIGLLTLEIGLRLLGTWDEDGVLHVAGHSVRPYVLPDRSLRRQIEALEKLERPYVIPDESLGWTIAPSASSADGWYVSNAIGARSDREFTLAPPPGVVRIALFGDSFVHGDDVALRETWAYTLEEELHARGVAAEVLNFGVGGYGNDQAYLRWKLHGSRYSPAVVLIGFQAENCLRNLNVIRKFYSPESGIPFSKPRFVLKDNQLELVNAPTLDYRRLPDEVAAFETSPLRQYETFYQPQDYQPRFLGSRLASVISDRLNRSDDRGRLYGPVAETLCFRIIERFVAEASEQSAVLVVHLPKRVDLERLATHQSLAYAPLLARLEHAFRVLDPTEALMTAAGGDLRALYQRHYTPRGNTVVATVVAEGLARAIRSALPPAGGQAPRE